MISKNIGFAFCGSYCTFEKAIGALQNICEIYENVIPVMSENAYKTDSRFGTAQSFIDRIETLCGKKIIHTISSAEPIGPQALLDLLIIAPCTGNTIAKLASGVTDSSVTMAAKAHLRNQKPILIAVSTNDGLSGNASNVGALLNRKNYYFVPYYQDDPMKKPSSIVADFNLLPIAAEAALKSIQLQPVLCAAPNAT
jgi:dipicolinate synthase subunit B